MFTLYEPDYMRKPAIFIDMIRIIRTHRKEHPRV